MPSIGKQVADDVASWLRAQTKPTLAVSSFDANTDFKVINTRPTEARDGDETIKTWVVLGNREYHENLASDRCARRWSQQLLLVVKLTGKQTDQDPTQPVSQDQMDDARLMAEWIQDQLGGPGRLISGRGLVDAETVAINDFDILQTSGVCYSLITFTYAT